MVQTVSIIVGEADRKRLAAIASDRARPLKHVQRAIIVLRSSERRNVLEVAELTGVSDPAVWRSGGLAVWRSGGLALAGSLRRVGCQWPAA